MLSGKEIEARSTTDETYLITYIFVELGTKLGYEQNAIDIIILCNVVKQWSAVHCCFVGFVSGRYAAIVERPKCLDRS